MGFATRKKDTRLNHHYELIFKRRIGARSTTEWYWSLNKIGNWIYKNFVLHERNFSDFFEMKFCPICDNCFNVKIKKGWRDSDYDGDIYWDIVKEISIADYEPVVYDVVLPNSKNNNHMFVANGFVVHNSYGLDLPAYRTVIKDLKRYGYRGYNWIPVLDYMQMSGRSGRPKYDTEGQSICIAGTEAEKEEIIERYLLGEPEEIDSKLAVEPVLRTYLLSLISANFLSTKEEIINFFGRTFWAHHFKDMEKLVVIIEKMLRLLIEWEFITSSQTDDFASADEIYEQKYRATLLGKRVAELYVDPLSANFIMKCLKRSRGYKDVKEIPLLQMVSHTNEMRPMLKSRQKDYEAVQEVLLKYGDSLLEKEPSMYDFEYEDFLDSIKTAIVFNEWVSEVDEEDILERYNVRPGELRAKIELADWMLYSAEEIARLMKVMDVISGIKKLRVRLRYGVKEELLSLIRLEGIGRARARKLYYNGIRDISDVKKSDLLKLKQILGEKVADSIKKQVDENIEPIKSGKRKGQINVMDFGDD